VIFAMPFVWFSSRVSEFCTEANAARVASTARRVKVALAIAVLGSLLVV
jgi:hypothetical protein